MKMSPDAPRPVITLLTDFGEEDGYVAAMKGVILSIAPHARIVDVAHYVPSFQISSAAYVLSTYYSYFPAGTIHVAVVDPGVGSSRKPMVLRLGGYFFVVPDNGIATFVLQRHNEYEAYEIEEEKYTLPRVSATFHGRDVFAPVGAHLALGKKADGFGPRVRQCALLDKALPRVSSDRIVGSVIHVDRFGNFITNISGESLGALKSPPSLFRIKRFTIVGLSNTYSDREKGEPVVYMGSSGFLEIGIAQGSAARTIPATIGDEVTVWTARKKA